MKTTCGARGPRPPSSGVARLRMAAALVLAMAAARGVAGTPEDGRPFEAPLPHAPLDGSLEVTGGFGEFRVGHFHAGVDLGTGQRVGKPVRACAGGVVERVRASGVGYGRSIYLRTDDGRLLQFGHLDAFAESLASFVRAQQDSTGQYEQDLWPARGRFHFRAGERIAWTGESGAGGPHLHFEIRRGDMAYHPLRAGLAASDTTAPTLASLTLEPLDDTSYVERGAAPYTIHLGAGPETLRVIGRVRAIVGARDGLWRGVDRMVPWSVAAEWSGETVECRFDSVSWATDMPEGDYVYDAGRVTGDKGLMLWAPAGFRPRMIRSSRPPAQEAGTLAVHPGDAPRALALRARDLGGRAAERSVTLVPGGRPVAGPAGAAGSTAGGALGFAGLPGGWLRATETGVPAGARAVKILAGSTGRWFTASPGEHGWSGVLPLGVSRAGTWTERILVRATTADGSPWSRSLLATAGVLDPEESVTLEHGRQRVTFPAGAAFERGVVMYFVSTAPAATGELEPGPVALTIVPADLPLRRPARLSLEWEGAGSSGIGLYREGDEGWEWVAATFDSAAHRLEAESRRLGRFALMRDGVAPRVALRTPPRRPVPGPYSRWAVEAGLTERGSGVDARASYLVVDGRRVPSEWDAEEKTLRWRPARAPGRGTHRVLVVATDRAGNVARSAGAFVLE